MNYLQRQNDTTAPKTQSMLVSSRATKPASKRGEHAGLLPVPATSPHPDQQSLISSSLPSSDGPAIPLTTGYTGADMQFLHHFTISTAPSLSERPTSRLAWQGSVVKLSFDHPFLLHGILAMSAMHLANLHAEQRKHYSITAADHQNIALQGFQNACQDIGSHNCDALFAFSMLVVRYIPASAGTVINENPSESFLNQDLFSAILEWLSLIQGVHRIIEHGYQWISRGPLTVFLQENANIDRRLSENDERRLADLEKLWYSDGDQIMEEDARCYQEALSVLRKHFSNINPVAPRKHNHNYGTYLPGFHHGQQNPQESEFDNIRLAFLWPIQAPAAYFELLGQRRPVALVVLAHYALLFKRACGNMWWTMPPPRKIMSAVSGALPPEYHKWISWPAEEIGMSDAGYNG